MPLNKQSGNMYSWVTHTWNVVKGKCPHGCIYCYMKRFPQRPLRFDEKELKETYEMLNSGEEPDIIIFGCPHASLNEIIKISRLVEGRKAKKPFWICTSRAVKEVAERMEIDKKIEEAGGRLVADTCMVVSPIENMFSTTGVNSAKAAHYLPGFCKQKVVFKSMEDLLR